MFPIEGELKVMEFHEDCHAEATKMANLMQDPKNKQLYDSTSASEWETFMASMYPKSNKATDFVRDFKGTEYEYKIPFEKELFGDTPVAPELLTKQSEVKTKFKKVQATASVLWHNRGIKQSRIFTILILLW
jgi:hypothetical protein